MDGEVGALARAVDGEEAQRGDFQAVEIVEGARQDFARDFRGGVRRLGRLDARAFLERRLRMGAVDGRAAAEEEAAHAGRARRLEEHGGADDVDVHVRRRPLQRGSHAGERSQVDDYVRPRLREGPPHRLLVADVALEEARAFRQSAPLQPLGVEGIEIVDDRDFVAAIEQRPDQMRADESCATRHQDALHATLLSAAGWA